MRTYNHAAVCAKCGGGDISTNYVHARSRPDFFDHDTIHRTCRRCFYAWSEMPLDLAAKRLADELDPSGGQGEQAGGGGS